jgi:two-component system phosphate regulon response regulator OmpR
MPSTPVPHILLVDDDRAVNQVLAKVLRRSGYVVTTAGSAQEAESLLGERFDALVLDLRLPGMRGDAFYFLASTRQPWLTCRALFLTGDISEQAEMLIGQTGCRWLRKPFHLAEMLDAVTAMAPLPPIQMPNAG